MATLLIVDDDTTIRETLHDLLSSDLECHTADRAEQAARDVGDRGACNAPLPEQAAGVVEEA